MANIRVPYDSHTGNTKKIAEHVYTVTQTSSQNNAKLLAVEDATIDDIKWCYGIAVGSPTNMGLLSRKMKKF